MKQKNIYNFETTHYYQRFDTWKQKEAEYVILLTSVTNLKDEMHSACFGELTFSEEDTKAAFASLKFEDEEGNKLPYNRKSSNAIVFDLYNTSHNPGIYDKFAIFRANSHSGTGQWFSLMAWNTKTGRHTTREFIDYDYQDLMHTINRWLFHLNTVERNIAELEKSRRNAYKQVA